MLTLIVAIISLSAIAALLSQLSTISYDKEYIRHLQAIEQYDAQPHDDDGEFNGTFDLW